MEDHRQTDEAKLEWLRTAAKEAFGQAGSLSLNSDKELNALFTEVHEEVAAELASERVRA